MRTIPSTSTGGAAKLQRAINQLTNTERLIASLPKQYDHDIALQITQEILYLKKRIERELAVIR